MSQVMDAIVIPKFGGPEVLAYQKVPKPEPKPGFALVHVKAVVVHQYIGGNQQSDNYYLDLRSLQIIRNPMRITPTVKRPPTSILQSDPKRVKF